ncbi:MAG: hypothetical protein NTV31_04955 [Bacteroidia bacterium]|nr:hypothetical protein [Bacteroidia bacterium]
MEQYPKILRFNLGERISQKGLPESQGARMVIESAINDTGKNGWKACSGGEHN